MTPIPKLANLLALATSLTIPTPTTENPGSSLSNFIFPTKGDVFILGDRVPVKWEVENMPANGVLLSLESADRSKSFRIAGDNGLSEGTFVWEVTNYNLPGNPGENFRLAVYDKSFEAVALSPEFSIWNGFDEAPNSETGVEVKRIWSPKDEQLWYSNIIYSHQVV
ncbi:hypothetical protein G7Y89_g7075 [Cudoniella acicularis]|uniref:Uncharacterized protein n=1 Tax=Cudoniella acicularis TaxID=354080 RepID=A0A8H4RJ90_9HELO|nr:hypothetical protein G7Y89_g7075 [Cudoniella acicularis]